MSEHKLIGHETYLEKFVTLYENNELPNKILLSGKKGIGKSLLTEKFLYKIFNSELLSDMLLTIFFALGSGILISFNCTSLKLIQIFAKIGNNTIAKTKNTAGNKSV